MASPLGAGDIIALTDKAWAIYKGFKGAPSSYASIAQDAYALHAILTQVQEYVRTTGLSVEQGQRLRVVYSGCSGVLTELEDLTLKYSSLGGPSMRAFDRFRYSWEDVAGLRGRLTSSTMALGTFKAYLSEPGNSGFVTEYASPEQIIRDLDDGIGDSQHWSSTQECSDDDESDNESIQSVKNDRINNRTSPKMIKRRYNPLREVREVKRRIRGEKDVVEVVEEVDQRRNNGNIVEEIIYDKKRPGRRKRHGTRTVREGSMTESSEGSFSSSSELSLSLERGSLVVTIGHRNRLGRLFFGCRCERCRQNDATTRSVQVSS